MTSRFPVFAALLAVTAAAAMMPRPSGGQNPPAHDAGEEGKRVYQRANCVGCHKWHGGGGGGYGGAALSLRQTQLTREQIIETVSCGRPGTGMPFHLRGAYDTQPCYGLMRKDLEATMPPEGAVFLRQKEIELVADYVVTHIKGKGEPSYDECITFFGEGSRVCNHYRTAAPASQQPAGE